ncbi:hypothetical protein [Alicyclobacillus sendaiensis]|uniref:hypothetical protein n=1 Tax=Alicyclobacillus sendaiensis TaxID=192387 RepID=UPI000AB68F4F|nr:hypothetical protein [Alicyclobacillus sendaiensis]
MLLGSLMIADFLEKTNGVVTGRIVTDAKNRWYRAEYSWSYDEDGHLLIRRTDGTGNTLKMPSVIELDEPLVSFFGLYSGDGAKGTEVSGTPGKVKPNISFSQREPHLVRFAVEQFRRLFPGTTQFIFSLGEDSAYFMEGEGLEALRRHYGGTLPAPLPLNKVRPQLNEADLQYLKEVRPMKGTSEEHLAFYYQHKTAMERILTDVKKAEIEASGLRLGAHDRVTASLRRPFKKGARTPGGSSRSDEVHLVGLTGFGELFLKMLHEIEGSILEDSEVSSQGLVRWRNRPSLVGEIVDVYDFFTRHPYGALGGERPSFTLKGGVMLSGKWPRSKAVDLRRELRIDPLWCYVAGLYLAEGSTPKAELFKMFRGGATGLSLGFTSSESISLELFLRTLTKLFNEKDCVATWKVKVGSQYFPELVTIGLKDGVPMLRGGKNGDGKLRTMEISLAIKPWALGVAPALLPYEDRFSHVEPTGAGLARIDVAASSALCRWYFPLLMYAVFGSTVADPVGGFQA